MIARSMRRHISILREQNNYDRLTAEAEAASSRRGGQSSSSQGPSQPTDRFVSPDRRRPRAEEAEFRARAETRRFDITLLEGQRDGLLRDMKKAQEDHQWADVSAISSQLSGVELKLGSIADRAAAGGWDDQSSSKGRGPSSKGSSIGSSKGYRSGKPGSDAKWRRT